MNQDYLTAVLFERQLFDDGYDTASLKERGLIKDPAKVLTEANAVVQKLLSIAKTHKIKPDQYTDQAAWASKIASFNADGLKKFAAELKATGLDITANKNYQLVQDYLSGGLKDEEEEAASEDDSTEESSDGSSTETAASEAKPEQAADDGAKAFEALKKSKQGLEDFLNKNKAAILYWAKQQGAK